MTKPARDLVVTKIKQVFPDRRIPEILANLDRYTDPERDRVHLAILKLCDEEGKSDPDDYVNAAIRDFRDVLTWAEAPNQAKLIACCDPGLRAEITEQDRTQYREWLEKR
ncbi:MAG: hypothetical protein OEU46_10990 [Alphaproteobacteria bacterium]|nr:hypothetical protein [Alphaproteobacteria bacterium]